MDFVNGDSPAMCNSSIGTGGCGWRFGAGAESGLEYGRHYREIELDIVLLGGS